MRIGIDFDNTLVCYDQLFWTLARNRGLIDESVARRKDSVRDHLRLRGLESAWTQMQGEAYGSCILEATCFPGVDAALAEFRRRDWPVCVISHKTLKPFAGPEYDLHEAARLWLNEQNLLKAHSTGLSLDRVFFELTKQAKLQRIADCRCDLFIDDLPELLSDPNFPPGVRKVLFDPHRQYPPSLGIRVLHNWNDAATLLNAEGPE